MVVMNDIAILRSIRCFYYPEERLFRTENGEVILNLYPLVPPSMIFMFRRNKRTVSYMNHKYHIKTILLYPTKEAV